VTRIPLRSDLQALSGYHSPQVDVPVRLNTNEAPFSPPTAWLDAVAEAAHDIEWNRYPDRAATELREGIAALHGVSADQVFVANGSNEVLQSILLAYSGAGRNVTMFSPTYQMHAQIARVVGATVVEGKRNADFTLDRAEIERVVAESKPAVSFICSPNNPTGIVEPRENVEAMYVRGARRCRCRRGVCTVLAVVGPRTRQRRHAARCHAHLFENVVDGRGAVGLSRRSAVAGGRHGGRGSAVPPRCVQAARRGACAGFR